MSKKKINGEAILKKIIPLFIEVPPSDPKYMPDYMKYNYRREKKIDKKTKTILEKEAEELAYRYMKALNII